MSRSPKDWRGIQVGIWTGLAPAKLVRHGAQGGKLWAWSWQCPAGHVRVATPERVRQVLRCRQCQRRKPGRKAADLTGRIFGSWAVLERAAEPKRPIYWRCRCRCGREQKVRGKHLVGGQSQSCRSCSAKERTVGTQRRRERIRAGLTMREAAERRGTTHQAIAEREHAQKPLANNLKTGKQRWG